MTYLLVLNRKSRRLGLGVQKGQDILVTASVAFIFLSLFLSILPRDAIARLIVHSESGTVPPFTAARSLTRLERNDRTWSDVKCRQEFPLLYPQLEDVTQYWRNLGGLNKSDIDTNEEHIRSNKFWGYTRVSGKGC
jgi:hypothetical protein